MTVSPQSSSTPARSGGDSSTPEVSGILRVALLVLAVLVGFFLLEGYTRFARVTGFATAHSVDATRRDDPQLVPMRVGALRVLVLGDSIAYSPGTPREQLWSTLLEEDLARRHGQVQVINAARPGDNTWSQLRLLREQIDRLQPDLVVLMYNDNDVYGVHQGLGADAPETEKTAGTEGTQSGASAEQAGGQINREYKSSLLVRVLRTLQRSTALNLLSLRTGLQLKAWGLVVPGSELAHLVGPAYDEQAPGWRATQDELRAMRDLCIANGASFGVYVVPQFDTLRHDLFAEVRARVGDALDRLGVEVHFGYDEFRGRAWRELAVSPFDGHPNALANRELATSVAQWLNASGLDQRAER